MCTFVMFWQSTKRLIFGCIYVRMTIFAPLINSPEFPLPHITFVTSETVTERFEFVSL